MGVLSICDKYNYPNRLVETVFFEYQQHMSRETRDFQQCDILTSVDSDEPVQPPLKVRSSKRCSVSSLTLIKYSSDKQRL